ncbi:MAG: response regulator [Verrucomicrobiota bacterium]|jgi:DNA-binding NarL/FixJ family response regulator
MNTKISTLIVDDEEIWRFLVSRALLLHDEIELIGNANSYQEALQQIDELKPKVLFLDVQIWDNQTCFELQKQINYKPIIVVVSGEADCEDRALKAGATAFMKKPFSKDDVAGVIRKVCARLG